MVTTHPVYWPLAIAHHHTLYTAQAEVTRQTLCVCQYLHNQVHYNIAREQMSHLSRVSPLISSRLCHSQKWVWPTQVFVRPSVGGWWPGWPGGSGGTLQCSLPTQICNEINWKWGLDTGLVRSHAWPGGVSVNCAGADTVIVCLHRVTAASLHDQSRWHQATRNRDFVRAWRNWTLSSLLNLKQCISECFMFSPAHSF